jgi:hypothetical protein
MQRLQRYQVDFIVHIAWQDAKGMTRRTTGRCVNISTSGAQVETRDQFAPRVVVMVNSDTFGRMGNAVVRYCRRAGMKYQVGLQFPVLLQLSDPVRQKMLKQAIGDDPDDLREEESSRP